VSRRTSQAFSVAAVVEAEAEVAFAFLADGMNQQYWALGSWDRRPLGEGLFVGTSLFDGTELTVRVIPRPELGIVDFETGKDAGSLAFAVQARIVSGAELGHGDGACLLTLTVFRAAAVDDDTWERLWHVFETEIHMIKGRLQIGWR
jgi:hypothetical protein